MAVSFKRVQGEYPRQFWILFCGRFIGSAGGSLVWPFISIYLRQRLNVPLTTVGLLLAISSGVGLVSQFILGLLSTLAFQFIGMVVTQEPAVCSLADDEGRREWR